MCSSDLQGARKNVRCKFLDADTAALDFCQTLARTMGLEEKVELVRDDVREFHKHARDFRPHVISAIGILEYLNVDQIGDLIGSMFECVRGTGGSIITSNMSPHPETRFLDRAVGWHMNYRTPEEMQHLLRTLKLKTSFDIVQEPLGIHYLVLSNSGGSKCFP